MEPTYPAARTVAAPVEMHFAECHAAAREQGDPELAPKPDAASIERIINAGFWASLRREEGRSPKISLAFLPPEQADHPLRFGHRLPLDPGTLTRLAPAVERPAIHLGVWRDGGELYLWGSTRTIPPSCFVLEVVEPGLLVVKRRRGQQGAKYANVAVLQGDQIKILDEVDGEPPMRLPLIASLLGFNSPRAWTDPVNVVVQLAVSMRAHAHGGSLLIVPGGSESWRDSIVRPIPYPVTPPFSELAELLQTPEEERQASWRESLHRAVEMIAGLTAVDGATVLTDRYELLGFGAKITRAPAGEPLAQVAMVEPVTGVPTVILDSSQLGGTRHLSAAQFVHDQRDALAFVASQDGRFTAFAWPPGESMVHALRVETLLL